MTFDSDTIIIIFMISIALNYIVLMSILKHIRISDVK